MTSFFDWNATTANSNGNADTTAGISIVENATPPSNINNGMRGMMWRLKQVHDDDAGIIVGTGTANAHVVVTKNVFATYASGITLTFKPVATNTGASTLNANTVGIKAIRKYNVLGADVALTGGEMLIGKPYRMLYDTTANAAAGAWLVLNPESIAGDQPYSPGTLYGLTLSNNVTDATNDIDIAVGAARNSIDTANIDLLTGLTKRLDAAWAVGTNQGGLDTGSVAANQNYYVYAIKRPDTGVVDVLFSINGTTPTLPTNYTLYRLIGAFYRTAGGVNQYPRSLSVQQTDWVSYTPTYVGVGTVTNLTCRSRRNGPDLELLVQWTNGTVTASTFSVTMGYAGVNGTIVCDATWTGFRPVAGPAIWNANDSSLTALASGASNLISIGASNSGAATFTLLTGTQMGTGTVLGLSGRIPIQGWTL